jgi:hypothetical protein
MQYQISLNFVLKGTPSEQLLHFVQAGKANVVLATQTFGGNLIASSSDIHQLTLRLPLLKEHITFSSQDCPDKIRRNLVLYNFACSLGVFTLVHTAIAGKNHFAIRMITDVKQDFELLKATSKRFGNIS